MDQKKIDFISSFWKHLNAFHCFTDDVRDFIACQFALESNFGESSLAQSCYNLSGMKHPLVRPTTSIHAYNGFATYGSVTSCVVDYVLWISYRKPLRKELEDINLFKGILKNYCPEKDYIDKINKIYSQFKKSTK